MSKACYQIVGQLPPERVVPAKLSATSDVVTLELLQIGADFIDGLYREGDIGRAVIGDARTNAPRPNGFDELSDRQ